MNSLEAALVNEVGWHAGLLDPGPAKYIYSFHPTIQDQAAQLMDDIVMSVPINISQLI
jgi:hypothetical protein